MHTVLAYKDLFAVIVRCAMLKILQITCRNKKELGRNWKEGTKERELDDQRKIRRKRKGKGRTEVKSCPILSFYSINQFSVWGFGGDQILVLRVRSICFANTTKIEFL